MSENFWLIRDVKNPTRKIYSWFHDPFFRFPLLKLMRFFFLCSNKIRFHCCKLGGWIMASRTIAELLHTKQHSKKCWYISFCFKLERVSERERERKGEITMIRTLSLSLDSCFSTLIVIRKVFLSPALLSPFFAFAFHWKNARFYRDERVVAVEQRNTLFHSLCLYLVLKYIL